MNQETQRIQKFDSTALCTDRFLTISAILNMVLKMRLLHHTQFLPFVSGSKFIGRAPQKAASTSQWEVGVKRTPPPQSRCSLTGNLQEGGSDKSGNETQAEKVAQTIGKPGACRRARASYAVRVTHRLPSSCPAGVLPGWMGDCTASAGSLGGALPDPPLLLLPPLPPKSRASSSLSRCTSSLKASSSAPLSSSSWS